MFRYREIQISSFVFTVYRALAKAVPDHHQFSQLILQYLVLLLLINLLLCYVIFIVVQYLLILVIVLFMLILMLFMILVLQEVFSYATGLVDRFYLILRILDSNLSSNLFFRKLSHRFLLVLRIHLMSHMLIILISIH